MTHISNWSAADLVVHEQSRCVCVTCIELRSAAREELQRRERVAKAFQAAAVTTPPTIQQLQEAYAIVDRERNEAVKQRDDAARGLALRSDDLRTALRERDDANRTRNEAEAFVSELQPNSASDPIASGTPRRPSNFTRRGSRSR